MIPHGLHTPTYSVLYSLDDGQSWEEHAFAAADAPLDVESVRVEPDNAGKKFVLVVSEAH